MDGKCVFEYHLAKPLFTLLKVHGYHNHITLVLFCWILKYCTALSLQFNEPTTAAAGHTSLNGWMCFPRPFGKPLLHVVGRIRC